MAGSCNQCGAALGEHEVFCTRCGARRSQANARCREALLREVWRRAQAGCEVLRSLREPRCAGSHTCRFCDRGCNLRQAGTSPRHRLSTRPPPDMASGAADCGCSIAIYSCRPCRCLRLPMQPPKKEHTVAKILISVMVVLFLIVGGVVGAGIYIGYRIKKKAEQVEQSYKKALAETTSKPAVRANLEASRTWGNFSEHSSQAGPGPVGKRLRTWERYFRHLSQGQSGSSPDLAKILASPGS